jgi:ribokinase
VPARTVLVIGSANVDVSVRTAVLPRPGETVIGDAALIGVGGKGANQAVAAARAGAHTRLMARLGEDAFAPMIRAELQASGVTTDEVLPVRGEATGLAAIYVDHAGQNCIVVVPGANARLAPHDLDAGAALIRDAAVIVLQCETPPATVAHAIGLAAACGTPVILNPAPSGQLELARLPRGITYLIPNETEAADLSGLPVRDAREAAHAAARLRAAGVECVIITLGADGCVAVDEHGATHHSAHAVATVDTTGAGDAFVGCLAAALAAGCGRDEAIRRALLYASMSTTRRGAQASYPRGAEYAAAWARIAIGEPP